MTELLMFVLGLTVGIVVASLFWWPQKNAWETEYNNLLLRLRQP